MRLTRAFVRHALEPELMRTAALLSQYKTGLSRGTCVECYKHVIPSRNWLL